MELSTFFDNFEALAEAPNGVQKLREMVLQLAVQGKIVSQDLNDEPASVLLEKILSERDKLTNEGKIKKAKPLPPLSRGDISFGIPSVWEWVRLGTIVSAFQNGCSIRKSEVGLETIVIRLADINNNTIDLSNVRTINLTADLKAKYSLNASDILVTRVNGSVDIVGSFSSVGDAKDICYCDHFIRMRTFEEYIYPPFLCVLGRSQLVRMKIQELFITTAGQKTVNQGHISSIPICIPPRNEQVRIVAKVDELMALCDDLEARKQKTHQTCIQLNDASIDKLLTAPAPAKFNRHWQRICDNFDLLYGKPENVTKLRQAILQLAVQGKLVPQDPNDEPACVTLKKKYELPSGYKRKRKLIKKLNAKMPDVLFPALPESWTYSTIQNLYELNIVIDYADGNHGSLYPRKANFGPEGVIFITAKDIWNGRVDWVNCSHLDFEYAKKLTKGWAKGGDLLLTHNATVGRVALVESHVSNFLLGTSVTFYRLNEGAILPAYLFFVLQSFVWQGQLEAIMQQTTRNQVSIQKQANFKIPIPPYDEQNRIVAKIDELMVLCSKLEAQLINGQAKSGKLLEAAVADLLAA